MDLNYFRDVSPNWKVVEKLSLQESATAMDLIFLTAFIDGRLTDDERDTLVRELQALPFVIVEGWPEATHKTIHTSAAGILGLLRQRNAEVLKELIETSAKKVVDPEKRLALLRILAIVAVVSDASEIQQDLLYRIGDAFGFELDTVESLLRATWGSYQQASTARSG